MRVVLRQRSMVAIGAIALGPVLLCPLLLSSSSAMAVAGHVTGGGLDPAIAHDGWGDAIKVPGLAALDTGDSAGVSSASCAAPGDCTVVGSYTISGFYRSEVYVISQVRGTWGKAVELPGLAALDKGRSAGVGSVSCPSPGNCGTGGSYTDRNGHRQPFVTSQVHGTWRRAKNVPGMAGLHAIGGGIGPVSCPSPGDCVAAGSYSVHPFREQAFVVSQAHGTWGNALAIPGLATLNTRHGAGVSSISCASPGNCTAGGSYSGSERNTQAFVVSEVNGTWGQAEEVPGTAVLNTGGYASLGDLSCASPGNCTAIGNYLEVFVSDEIKGIWSTAIEIPGTASLNRNHWAFIGALSCAARLRCVVGGTYIGHSDVIGAFIDSRT